MNLSKHDPETEMEMNMTPMIDVVFLLIIFFMIITDMTQQDLEELVLPMAQFAREDKPDPDEYRPIINIQYDGKIIIKRETYYSPEENDQRVAGEDGQADEDGLPDGGSHHGTQSTGRTSPDPR